MKCGMYAGTADGAAMTCQLEINDAYPCPVHGAETFDTARCAVGGCRNYRGSANEFCRMHDTPLRQELKTGAFVTTDSGERHTFDSGMVRDTSRGKARFDLLFPVGVAYQDQFVTRVAELMMRGAEKYDDRNWEKASGSEELARFKASAIRHLVQWLCDDTTEDHAAAVVFNVMAHETTLTKDCT